MNLIDLYRRAVYADRELSRGASFLAIALTEFASWEDGTTWVSQARLAAVTKCKSHNTLRSDTREFVYISNGGAAVFLDDNRAAFGRRLSRLHGFLR